MNSRVRGGGAKLNKFVDGKGEKDGRKLDLPATHQINGSNPTKLHHTKKSPKNGAIFGGDFRN